MSSYKELAKMVQTGRAPATDSGQEAKQNNESRIATSYMQEKLDREQPAARVPVGNASRKLDRQQRLAQPASTAEKLKNAQWLYDSYTQSEEYRKNLAAANKKAQTDHWMNAAITGDFQAQVTPARDEKEQYLKAMVDHYKAQIVTEENQTVTDANLLELESWSEEDRAALDHYIATRDQETVDNLNPLLDSSFGQRALLGSSALIKKYGKDKVDKMAETLARTQNAQTAEQVDQDARAAVNRSTGAAIGHNALSVGTSGIGGLMSMMGYIRELGQRTGQYSTMDANNAGNMLNVYSGAVRDQTAQNIAGDEYDENGNLISDGGVGRQLLALGYQGVMSMADNYARLVLGGGSAGGAALAATNSFAQTMSEASAKGATPGQAVILATTTAAIEALSEKIPPGQSGGRSEDRRQRQVEDPGGRAGPGGH